jgi:hypothetical protein
MAWKRGGNQGGAGQKSSFTRIGNLFSDDKPPKGASKRYSTTASGKYLDAVVAALVEAHKAGKAVKFYVTKWDGQEQPVLTLAPASDKKPIKVEQEPGLDLN